MPRARNIKPAFFTNDRLAECEPLARILFIGLWTISDREGRLEDRPKKIKAETLPYDNCDPDLLLNQLHNGGFIIRYKYENTSYIQIVNFVKHQNCHMKESASIIPAPDKHHTSIIPVGLLTESFLLNPETLLLKPDILSAEKSSAPPRKVILKLNPKELDEDWLIKSLPPDNVIEMWNEVIVGEENKKGQIHLTEDRRKKIQSRARDSLPDGQHWLDYFQSIAVDAFCMGENDRGWKASIDWALKTANIIKMKEGGYGKKVR